MKVHSVLFLDHLMDWESIFENDGLKRFLMYIAANLLVILLVTSMALYVWKRRYWYLASRKFQGPLALPLIGNAWMFMCKNEEILMKIYEVTKKCNREPMRFWLGPSLLIVFTNLDHVEKILSSTKFAYKHDVYDFIKVYVGDGLISGSGPKYKTHRRIIQPMFNMCFVSECTRYIQNHVDVCMNQLEEYVGKATFDFGQMVHKCMVDVFKEIILGSQERSQLNGLNAFDQALTDGYDYAFSRIVKPYLQPDFLYKFTPYKKIQDRLRKALRTQAKQYIEASRKRRQSFQTNPGICPIIDRLTDFMDENPGVITDEEFVDHVITLHAASEDTVTIVSGFLAVCFGMYPECQAKAAKEIREIFGECPRPVTMEDINRLEYLDRCIKEVLRLFTIGPVILRKCTGDFEIDGKIVPKGCAIVVPIFTIHRDPKYWQTPDHFNPDNFLPEIVNKRHTYAYMPFSAGPRGCIGKILANVTLKIFACNLLQRFEIEANGKVPDLELKMEITTRPKHGYNLRLKKRIWS